MLVLTLLAQSFGAPQDEHLFWAALFGWYVMLGAGPLSLDHVLSRGLADSPLPLAGPATAALGWVNREVGPLYLLGITRREAISRRCGHTSTPARSARSRPMHAARSAGSKPPTRRNAPTTRPAAI